MKPQIGAPTRPSILIPALCGNCDFAEPQPDLKVVACHGVPPTPCITGGQQTLKGPEYQVEMMVPRVPRALKGCALWRWRAEEVN